MRNKTIQAITSQQTRDQIYNSAIELIQKNGYRNTTIKDISMASGHSVGSIYHFFGSKIGIIRRVMVQAIPCTLAEITLTEEHLLHPTDAILSAFTALSKYYEEKVGIDLVQNARELRIEDEQRPRSDRLYTKIEDTLSGFIHEAKLDQVSCINNDAESITGYFMAMYYSCVINWAWNGFNRNTTLQEVTKKQFEIALHPFTI